MYRASISLRIVALINVYGPIVWILHIYKCNSPSHKQNTHGICIHIYQCGLFGCSLAAIWMSLLATRDPKWFLTRSPWPRESFSLQIKRVFFLSATQSPIRWTISVFFFPSKVRNPMDQIHFALSTMIKLVLLTNLFHLFNFFSLWRHNLFIPFYLSSLLYIQSLFLKEEWHHFTSLWNCIVITNVNSSNVNFSFLKETFFFFSKYCDVVRLKI